MPRYGDAHRLLLQVFISKHLLSDKDAQMVYQKIGQRLQLDLPDTGFSNFINLINDKLSPFFMQIRAGRGEDDGIKYWALVNTTEDEASKFATNFTAQEIEYIKKVIEAIVLSDGSASSTELINLSTDVSKTLTVKAAEELLLRLKSSNWLTDKKGMISLGPRAVIELGQYLEGKFKDNIGDCQMCHTVVIMGDVCEHCSVKIHKYCAATKFQGLDADRRVCPACKGNWTKPLVSLPKDSGDNTSAPRRGSVEGTTSGNKRAKRR